MIEIIKEKVQMPNIDKRKYQCKCINTKEWKVIDTHSKTLRYKGKYENAVIACHNLNKEFYLEKKLDKSEFKIKRPEILVDMDNVLCDYRSLYIKKMEQFPDNKYPQSQYGFFLELEPMYLAVECFIWMTKWADVSILTAPSYYNPSCLAEKNYWVRKLFGIEYAKKTIMAHDKSKVFGHYLIDDGVDNGQKEWAKKHKGTFIQFGSTKYPDWKATYEFLKKEATKNGWKVPLMLDKRFHDRHVVNI